MKIFLSTVVNQNPFDYMSHSIITSMMIILCTIIYFFPSIIAVITGSKKLIRVIVVNTFLGVFIVGWIVSFMWVIEEKLGKDVK